MHFYTELTVLGIHESKRPDVNLIFSTAIVPSTVISPMILSCHYCINNSRRNYLISLSTVASNVGKLIKLLFYG